MGFFNKKEKQYRRLFNQRGLVILGTQSLWLAQDHILLLTTYFSFKEDYRRFYFKDIQWVMLRKTFHGKATNIMAGVLAGLFSLLFLTNNEILRIFGAVFVSLFLLVLLVNLLMGPTCQCEMGTAVQEAHLKTLSRLRKARKFVKIISPLIEQAQGSLSPEMFSIGPATPEQTTQPPQTAQVAPADTRIADIQAPFHKALFVLLIVSAVMGLLNFFWQGFVFGLTAWTVFALEIFALMGALVRQFTHSIPRSVSRLVFIVIIYMFLFLLVENLHASFEFVAQGSKNLTMTQWEIYKDLFNKSPDSSQFTFFLTLLEVFIGMGLGFSGLGLLKKYGAFGELS